MEFFYFSENSYVLLVSRVIDHLFHPNEIVDIDPIGCDITVFVRNAVFPGNGEFNTLKFLQNIDTIRFDTDL